MMTVSNYRSDLHDLSDRRRRIQRAEDWSGFPLRWFGRRLFYTLCAAALAGVLVATGVVTANHYSDVPPTVTVCTVTACTPGE